MAFGSYRADVCYGIDGSESRMIVVRSERARGRVSHAVVLDAAGETAGAKLAAFLADRKKEWASGRAVVSVSMPVAQSFTRWLQTPLKSPAKARKVGRARRAVR